MKLINGYTEPTEPSSDSGQQQQSVFNGALALLARIDLFRLEAARCRSHLNILGWLTALDSVLAEFYALLNPDEIKSVDDARKGVIGLDVLFYSPSERRLIKYSSQDGSLYAYEPNPKIYGLLHDYDLLINKLLNSHGMLMPSPADPRFAMQRGR